LNLALSLAKALNSLYVVAIGDYFIEEPIFGKLLEDIAV